MPLCIYKWNACLVIRVLCAQADLKWFETLDWFNRASTCPCWPAQSFAQRFRFWPWTFEQDAVQSAAEDEDGDINYRSYKHFINERWLGQDSDVVWCGILEELRVDSGQEQTPLQQKLDDFGNLLAKVLMAAFVFQTPKDVQSCHFHYVSLCFTILSSWSAQDDSWMLILQGFGSAGNAYRPKNWRSFSPFVHWRGS